jgi:hypothetical protein
MKVTDAAKSVAYTSLMITVVSSNELAGPLITTRALPAGFAGAAYSAQVEAAGGQPPYSWSTGAMPPGLTLATNGAVFGMPLNEGLGAFVASVLDNAAAGAQALVAVPLRWLGYYVNTTVKKCRVVIRWNKRDEGMADTDSVSLRITFDAPSLMVVDGYARGTVSIGNYTIPLAAPSASSWRKYASFKSPSGSVPKTSATLRWKAGNVIALSVTLKKARLAEELERYGLSRNAPGTFLLPFRAVINEFDTGAMTLSMEYKLVGTVKGVVTIQ